MPEPEPSRNAPPGLPEVLESAASALAAVRLYPLHNPVSVQSLGKAFILLTRYLAGAASCTFILSHGKVSEEQSPSAHTGRGTVSEEGDFDKGYFRTVTVYPGITETELGECLLLLSRPESVFSPEERKLLYQEGRFSHIAIRPALPPGTQENPLPGGTEKIKPRTEKSEEIDTVPESEGLPHTIAGLVSGPAEWGKRVLIDAKKHSSSFSETADNVFRAIRRTSEDVRELSERKRGQAFHAMALSLLSLDPDYLDGVVRRIESVLDAGMVRKVRDGSGEGLISDMQEILSCRLHWSWTAEQLSRLLVRMTEDRRMPEETALSVSVEDLSALNRHLGEYTPEDLDDLHQVVNSGTGGLVRSAAVRTLSALLENLTCQDETGKYGQRDASVTLIINRLHEMLSAALAAKDYEAALLILQSTKTAAAARLRTRPGQENRSAEDRKTIVRLVNALLSVPAGSPAYEKIHACLSCVEREATPVLLELLATEEDRTRRKLLTGVLRELGKDQLAVLGAKLSDERWYFVRNIVEILGQSRKEEVISYLEAVAGHDNFQIRQEVVRALLTIGGTRAADLLIGFLKDDDVDIRFMALRGLGSPALAGEKTERGLIEFLHRRRFKRIDQNLRLEAIDSLARTGGRDARDFLVRFLKVKWWMPKHPQQELATAAETAVREIERRIGDRGIC